MRDLTKNEEIQKLFETATDYWSVTAQMLVLAEECSELSAAATRVLTHKGSESDVVGEMADVYIMISQMVYSLPEAVGFDQVVEEKLKKLRNRLESQGARIETGGSLS